MIRQPLTKIILFAAWLLLATRARAPAAEPGTYTLKESPADSRIESVDVRVKVSGTAEFAIEKGQFLAHPIVAEANLKFRERWLAGAGRGAEALRSL